MDPSARRPLHKVRLCVEHSRHLLLAGGSNSLLVGVVVGFHVDQDAEILLGFLLTCPLVE